MHMISYFAWRIDMAEIGSDTYEKDIIIWLQFKILIVHLSLQLQINCAMLMKTVHHF